MECSKQLDKDIFFQFRQFLFLNTRILQSCRYRPVEGGFATKEQ